VAEALWGFSAAAIADGCPKHSGVGMTDNARRQVPPFSGPRINISHRLHCFAISAAVVCAAATCSAQESPNPPNFSPDKLTGWVPLNYGDTFVPPLQGPGPVVDDPRYTFVSNAASARTGKRSTFHIADLANSILQPWTREALRKQNERILSGKPGYSVQVSCIPLGVPAFVLHPVQPLYFIQTANMVVMINQENLDARRIYLNVPHSPNINPSWTGESVGHYEGDSLVVDTLGINGKTYIDNFRTPHTEKLHVVERFHMIDGGKMLEANINVEDPGAFTTAWSALQRWRRVEQGPIYERVCAENPLDLYNRETDPVPQAARPDF
jgi:hypothetical protein